LGTIAGQHEVINCTSFFKSSGEADCIPLCRTQCMSLGISIVVEATRD